MARKLGLVLGSGAARGWAHVGVLRGLEEIGVKPDIIAGCSVGALVGGAYLIGALEEFEAWGRELSPLSAIGAFNFWVNRGGLVDAAPAFEAFAAFDRNIEDLPIKFGAVAADLGTGEEVWITQGSVIDAARASSAIPVLFHAVQRGPRWLVDGAVANPAPVSLARYLGADIVLSVDLNAIPRVLSRFNPPPPGVPALDPLAAFSSPDSFSGAVTKFIEDTRSRIERQMAIAKSRAQSKPQLFETAYAAVDIFQMHLTRLRAETSPPDIHLTPDMRDALPNSFDRADEFIENGRAALLHKRDEIFALLKD
ncbi:MAG TPA: patatin-like phospholipase family protein [Parvularculaceae bacterium]|nr:patatin-like phospholipase family protein [Parvularculaceae bacterium]